MRRKDDEWSIREEAHLRRWWGYKPLAQLSKELRRSETAVTVRSKRLGLRSLTRLPECLTEGDLSEMLGIDSKSVWRMMREVDSLPVSTIYKRNMPCRVVWKHDLLRWLRDWRNWVYVDVDKVQDEQVRRVLRREQGKWRDEWLSAGTAATLLGLQCGFLNKLTRKGVFKEAVKYGNWWYLKSEVDYFKRLTRP